MQVKPELAIGFVVYHPTDEFYRRLELVSNTGFKLYIFDNSPSQTNFKDVVDKFFNIKYITAGKNLGLGVGLSVINATAYYEGYSSLVFFDQDTGFTIDTLNYIYDYVCSNNNKTSNDYGIVVFSSNIDDSKINYQIQETSLVISSGSLYKLDMLRQVNWHNEKYFVDGVDYEICLRMRYKGFKVGVCYNTPGFDHVNEQPDKVIKLFSLSLLIRRYSLSRIIDSVGAYLKLVFAAIKALDIKFTILLMRSFSIYVLGQFLSRLLIKKS